MPQKLLWSQIKEMYLNQWVELSDVDWPTESAYPRKAIVRTHTDDRNELLEKISKLNRKRLCKDTVVLFIGPSQSRIPLQFPRIAA